MSARVADGGIQAAFFATLVDEWARGGLTDAVMSPGNRSTLLALQLDAHPRIQLHVVVDERCAGFLALGIALGADRPALVWTTSGTAAAELHPAVIEADLAGVPLLVATADRPPETHAVRDWQTVDQVALFGGSLRWRHSPGVASEETRWSWRTLAARALLETRGDVGARPGPVHLNLAIREPWRTDPDRDLIQPGRQEEEAWHGSATGKNRRSSAGGRRGVVEELTKWAGQRGVIVAGRGAGAPDVIHDLAEVAGWPVLADLRSACRRADRRTTVAMADLIVRAPGFAAVQQPQFVLRLGDPVVSKAIATWLADAGATEWLVTEGDPWQGAAAAARAITVDDPTELCRALTIALTESRARSAPEEWLAAWTDAEKRARAVTAEELGDEKVWSEPALARGVFAALPAGADLVAGPSLPVRDLDVWTEPRDDVRVFANRGASGMDGITSTAAGIALASGRPTVALVGDLTFLYDLNALWALCATAKAFDLVVVVSDNDGGGIFASVPQLGEVEAEAFERLVATPTGVDIPTVARALGATVTTVDGTTDLSAALAQALSAGGLQVMHARFDRAETVGRRVAIVATTVAAIDMGEH